jgi:predicted nucleic acid-binding protein
VNVYVLDASVAAKWFLPSPDETLLDEASILLEDYAAGRVNLIVPELFWPEFGNILWKAVRRARISERSAESAIAELEARGIAIARPAGLLLEAFRIATTFDRTVYDAIYVALAVFTGATLVTADERLANALGTSLPVQWLGAYRNVG